MSVKGTNLELIKPQFCLNTVINILTCVKNRDFSRYDMRDDFNVCRVREYLSLFKDWGLTVCGFDNYPDGLSARGIDFLHFSELPLFDVALTYYHCCGGLTFDTFFDLCHEFWSFRYRKFDIDNPPLYEEFTVKFLL